MDFLTRVLLVAAAAAALAFLGVALVRFAKKRSVGALALGSILLLFGVGAIKDPENHAIAQAKAPKLKEEDDSGDPPNDKTGQFGNARCRPTAPGPLRRFAATLPEPRRWA
jgi:hypothetical protein